MSTISPRSIKTESKQYDIESSYLDAEILNKYFDENENLNGPVEDPIIDSRFQSYLRFYIADILNGDRSRFADSSEGPQSKTGALKIKNCYSYKVSVCGNIVNIYDAPKFYRIRVDDSTGCILVTLWKTSVFKSNSLNCSGSYDSRTKFNDLYNILGSIQKQIKEEKINNSIMYEPRIGDLVLIRAHVKCYKQNISLSAISCVRLQDSTEELTQIMLPAILSKRIYSVKAPSKEQFDSLKQVANPCHKKLEPENNVKPESKPGTSVIKDMEAFLTLVDKKLNQITSKSADYTLNNQSCSSYNLYTYLRSNCPVEYKFVTAKQVLDALKELELRGLVYSCEDDNHYLPIN